VDLVIRAVGLVPGLPLIIAGTGTERATFEALVETLGIADRVTFAGEVDDATLIALYAGALAVVYPPYDEDFGYVTLESFLSHKPVVTTTDSGEPIEFVIDGVNGRVTAPSAEALADALAALASDPAAAARMGAAGYDRARTITWDGVVDRLVHAG
jgi:glycosyltransferase involved in cell wall biosynthesis